MAVCSCLCHQKKTLEPVCTTCQDHYEHEWVYLTSIESGHEHNYGEKPRLTEITEVYTCKCGERKEVRKSNEA